MESCLTLTPTAVSIGRGLAVPEGSDWVCDTTTATTTPTTTTTNNDDDDNNDDDNDNSNNETNSNKS